MEEWIEAGIRLLLKRTINKGMLSQGSKFRMDLDDRATDTLFFMAETMYRTELEVEVAHWLRKAQRLRQRALEGSLIAMEEGEARALINADLMERQASRLLQMMKTPR